MRGLVYQSTNLGGLWFHPHSVHERSDLVYTKEQGVNMETHETFDGREQGTKQTSILHIPRHERIRKTRTIYRRVLLLSSRWLQHSAVGNAPLIRSRACSIHCARRRGAAQRTYKRG